MKALPILRVGLLLGLTSLSTLTAADAPPPPQQETKLNDGETPVQLAILLDTSNSMDGLIEQAKTQLWKIVNEFNDAKQGQKKPVVQVALYEYGNSRLSVGTNYIRQILPFTRDLDQVSAELFKLTTNGGEEYCGAVIRAAIDSLSWDKNDATYKAIFIAGNEPFTQGGVAANEACKAAAAKDIVVNTIHCGSRSEGENTGWHTGAALADGRFLTIDQDKAVAHIESPQDKEIARISIELNKTYIAYGNQGREKALNQVAQDNNAIAKKEAGAELQRALTKSSSNYKNGTWDLVDACKKDGLKLDSLPKAQLPRELQELAPAARQAVIDEKAAERVKLQTQIQVLNEERKKFIAAQSQLQDPSKKADTLDNAIAAAVKEQAAKKKIEFK
jgi:hypothetical protein